MSCRGELRRVADGVQCIACAAMYRTADDVTNFAADLHPVAARERDAVQGLDAAGAADGRLPALLRHLVDDQPLSFEDLRAFPCLEHARGARHQVADLLRQRPLPADAIVVEVGADHGWLSSLLVDAGCRVIASDINDHLRMAPHGSSPRLCRLQADMNGLPIADASVDVFWATAAMHHSWNLERTFAEAARVVRPGGRLYLCCEPMPSRLRYPFGHGFGKTERGWGINEQWIPRSQWLALCRRASFTPELVFPELDDAAMASKLAARGLPTILAPLLTPFLRALQVSIHLIARRAG
jgi:SAM-dependent methyltransferase